MNEGWLTPAEADYLRVLAERQYVLELGAWKGRSTAVLAETAKYVVSIDRHQGIKDGIHDEDSLPDYLANIRDLPNVAIVIADWHACDFFIDSYDLVYVDGDHDADSVERDVRLANHCSRDLIAFHDWDIASVREGVGRVRGLVARDVVGSVASFWSPQ